MRLDEIVEKECLNTHSLSNMLIQDPTSSEGRIISLKPAMNHFIMMRGEAVYNFQCEEVIASVDEIVEKDVEGSSICFDSLKVKVNGQEMFVKPHLRTLSKTAETAPCTEQLPVMFQSKYPNSWIKVDSK